MWHPVNLKTGLRSDETLSDFERASILTLEFIAENSPIAARRQLARDEMARRLAPK